MGIFRIILRCQCEHNVYNGATGNIGEALDIMRQLQSRSCPQCGNSLNKMQMIVHPDDLKKVNDMLSDEIKLLDRQASTPAPSPSLQEIELTKREFERKKLDFPVLSPSHEQVDKAVQKLKELGMSIGLEDQETATRRPDVVFERILEDIRSAVCRLALPDTNSYVTNIPLGVVSYPLLNAVTCSVTGSTVPYILLDFNLLKLFYDFTSIMLASMDVTVYRERGHAVLGEGRIDDPASLSRDVALAKLFSLAICYGNRNKERRCIVKPDLSAEKTSATRSIADSAKEFVLVHEIAHAVLHHDFKDRMSETLGGSFRERSQQDEFEADEWAVSFISRMPKLSSVTSTEGGPDQQYRIGASIALSCFYLLENAKRIAAVIPNVDETQILELYTQSHPPTLERHARLRERLGFFVPSNGLSLCDHAHELVLELVADVEPM